MADWVLPDSISPSRMTLWQQCLARDSLILTKGDGYKPIQKVVPGDLVLTHKGRWRPVMAAERTGVKGVVEVRAQGVSGLTLTPDHRVWARLPSGRKADAKQSAMKVEPGWVASADLGGAYVNRKLPPEEPSSVTDQEWWIVGRWLADGYHQSIMKGKYGPYDFFYVTCGKHETDELVAKMGDHAGNVSSLRTANKVYVRCENDAIYNILRRCGTGSAGKHLPPEAFTLPRRQAEALLAGYLSGDGHLVPERPEKPSVWMASSVSRELLMGVTFLVQRARGAIASTYAGRGPGTSVIEGRTVSTRQCWMLQFSVQRPGSYPPFVLNDGAWMRVRHVDDAGMAETWNLRVEEDESYTAEGCIVKNCPLKFRVETMQKLRGGTNAAAVAGTTAHLALEWLMQLDGPERTPEILNDELIPKALSEIKESDEYLSLTEEELKGFDAKVERVTPRLFDMIDVPNAPVMSTERHFEIDLDGWTLRGYIDLMLGSEDRIYLWDHKTGKTPQRRYQDKAMLGIRFYAVAVEIMEGVIPAKIALGFLDTRTTLAERPTEQSVAAMKAKILRVRDEIGDSCADGHFPTKTSALCDWCDLKPACPAHGGSEDAIQTFVDLRS